MSLLDEIEADLNNLQKIEHMIFREAQTADVPQMHAVRIAVHENKLSDPHRITAGDYEKILTHFGKGWVCEFEGRVVGFAIVNLSENNVWALFVDPSFEGKGIGKKLQFDMLSWYFAQSEQILWLGTSPNTRAEQFYIKTGWSKAGLRANGEVHFQMSREDWMRLKH